MKKQNWTQALAETIEAAKKRSFSWGKFDCCLFAAECVKAQTGVDPMPEFRGRYTTEVGAKRLLTKFGGIEKIMDSKFQRGCISSISRGDLVLIENQQGVMLGVAFNHVWVPSKNGVNVSSYKIITCWRVK